jgi:hypothetical protein
LDGSEQSTAPARGSWPSAVALFLLTLLLLGPASVPRPSVVIGIAYVLLIAALPVRRWPAYTLGAVTFALILTGEREGLWWVERGWAVLVGGWFIALTLQWPASGFLSRALGALAGSAVVAAALLAGRSGGWEMLDWQVTEHLGGRLGLWLVGAEARGQTLAPAMVSLIYRAGEIQAAMFPALAGLASLAGLAVAWWVYMRIALDRDEGLLPLREFRFNDHLVWLFIAGLALALSDGGEGLRRTGWNVVAFMGALYALRGAAVVAFFGGGQSLFGLFMVAVAVVLVPPVVLSGALVIGLGDTWLDLRARARALMA